VESYFSENRQFNEFVGKWYFPDNFSISSREVNSSNVGKGDISEIVYSKSRPCTPGNFIYQCLAIVSIFCGLERRLNFNMLSLVSTESIPILCYSLLILVRRCGDYLVKLYSCDIRRYYSLISGLRVSTWLVSDT